MVVDLTIVSDGKNSNKEITTAAASRCELIGCPSMPGVSPAEAFRRVPLCPRSSCKASGRPMTAGFGPLRGAGERPREPGGTPRHMRP